MPPKRDTLTEAIDRESMAHLAATFQERASDPHLADLARRALQELGFIDPPALPDPLPTPALDVWHEQLARKERTIFTFDPLWRAACAEMAAREAAHAGLPDIARGHLLEAAHYLLTAAQQNGGEP